MHGLQGGADELAHVSRRGSQAVYDILHQLHASEGARILHALQAMDDVLRKCLLSVSTHSQKT